MPTLILILAHSIQTASGSSDPSSSSSSSIAGFQVIASLISLGVIAFLVPFLKRENLPDNQ